MRLTLLKLISLQFFFVFGQKSTFYVYEKKKENTLFRLNTCIKLSCTDFFMDFC